VKGWPLLVIVTILKEKIERKKLMKKKKKNIN
jgi:hypothetical protein